MAMLDYAVKLTRSARDVTEDDIAALKAAGLSEPQILSTNLITAYFAFMTRLTSGLGVEHRPGRVAQMRRWLAGPARDLDWLFTDEERNETTGE